MAKPSANADKVVTGAGQFIVIIGMLFEGVNKGVDIYTLMAEIQRPLEHRVAEGYGKVDWTVCTGLLMEKK